MDDSLVEKSDYYKPMADSCHFREINIMSENDHNQKAAKRTKQLLKAYLSQFGISRIGDITGLDYLGINISAVVRPRSKSIIVFSGKGNSSDEAWVSGVLECIELYSAEPENYSGRSLTGSFGDLSRTKLVLDPELLILPIDHSTNHDTRINWIPANNILTNTVIFLPDDVVFIPSKNEQPIFSPTTNGLCAGITYEDALLHGLYEVIERDSCSFAEIFKDLTQINMETISSKLFSTTIEKSRKMHLDCRLYYYRNVFDIPMFFCVIEDTALRDICYFNIGHGINLNPVVAAERALIEAAQSRLLYISGAREDLWEEQPPCESDSAYEKLLSENGFGFLTTRNQSVEDFRHVCPGYETYPLATKEDQLEECIKRLTASGIDKILVADLTPEFFPHHVMRVIVPGLECYYSDQRRIGPRLRERFLASLVS